MDELELPPPPALNTLHNCHNRPVFTPTSHVGVPLSPRERLVVWFCPIIARIRERILYFRRQSRLGNTLIHLTGCADLSSDDRAVFYRGWADPKSDPLIQ